MLLKLLRVFGDALLSGMLLILSKCGLRAKDRYVQGSSVNRCGEF